MRKAPYFISPFLLLLLIVGCSENASQESVVQSEKIEKLDSVFKEPAITQKEAETEIPDTNKKAVVKLFQKKIIMSPNDSIISYKIVRSADKNCTLWSIPVKSELIKIITSFYEISGSDWHDCYGDWNCGVQGEIFFQSKNYNYRLDASGWIILSNKQEQRYFGCTNPTCKKYFPADCFCNEDGIIDQ